MGDCGIPDPSLKPHDVHAVEAIIDCANRFSGELEIIAQAPLTNIALALRQDPDLPKKVKRLWIMGGANNFIGNITPVAEFNFYVDPEAAHAVLRGGFEVTLVPWDICVHYGMLSRDELKPIIDMGSKLSEFYLKANGGAWSFVRSVMGIDAISHPDAITIAMAIDRKVILESADHFVDVEFRSELTRGYSVVDAGDVMPHVLDDGETVAHKMSIEDFEPNAEVVTKADKVHFTEMLIEVLKSL
jgi:purine nucleosidase